ncbi:MAG TPA: phage tail assembly chaperone, partial [Limnochordia bacterium]
MSADAPRSSAPESIDSRGFFAFLHSVAPPLRSPRSERWWAAVTSDGAPGGSAALLRHLWARTGGDAADSQALGQMIWDVAAALDQLPSDRGHTEDIAVFAARVARDPRAFDRDRPAGRLLERALFDSDADREALLAGLHEPELIREVLWAAAGLQRDPWGTFVLATGVQGVITRDRAVRRAMRHAGRAGLVAAYPQGEVRTWRAVFSPRRAVYVVQRSKTFGGLLAALRQGEPPGRWPVLALAARPLNVAALLFLDACAVGQLRIRCSADFTPAGLALAAALRRRYGAQCEFWHLTPADYHRAIDAAARRGRQRPLVGRERQRLNDLAAEFPDLAEE